MSSIVTSLVMLLRLFRKATKQPYSMSDHTTAWQKHKVRPPKGAKAPDKTNRDYCIYHPAHHDYTYNDKWIAVLIGELGGPNDAEAVGETNSG